MSKISDLRDEFAGKAMQALIANAQAFTIKDDADCAEKAYSMADAMLRARELKL